MQSGMLDLGRMGANMECRLMKSSAMRFQFGGHYEKPGNES